MKKIQAPKDSALIHTPLGVTAEVLGEGTRAGVKVDLPKFHEGWKSHSMEELADEGGN